MNSKVHQFTPVFIKLLKGPVDYTEKSTWEKIILYKAELVSFLLSIGLKLVLNEDDGYAYLQHAVSEDEDAMNISWIQRRSLTYEESIMLVLLREMMAEFEVGDATTRELIKKRREIKEYAELFFKEKASRVKFLKEIDRLIDKVEEYGFLSVIDRNDVLDEEKFRINKIIKAKVDGDILEQFKEQLNEHAAKRIQHG